MSWKTPAVEKLALRWRADGDEPTTIWITVMVHPGPLTLRGRAAVVGERSFAAAADGDSIEVPLAVFSLDITPNEEVGSGDVVRIDTNLVTVPLSVMDRQGKFIPDLRREVFRAAGLLVFRLAHRCYYFLHPGNMPSCSIQVIFCHSEVERINGVLGAINASQHVRGLVFACEVHPADAAPPALAQPFSQSAANSLSVF